MAEEWHYADNEREKVPASEEQLKKLASAGEITSDTLVWNPDLPDWTPCGLVRPEWFDTKSPSTETEGSPPTFSPTPDPDLPPSLPPHVKPGSSAQPHPLAITSMVCGIISLVTLGCLSVFGLVMLPLSLAAIVCGHLALSKMKQPGSIYGGRGLAVAGLVTGYIGLVSMLLLTALFGLMLLVPTATPPKIEAIPGQQTRFLAIPVFRP